MPGTRQCGVISGSCPRAQIRKSEVSLFIFYVSDPRARDEWLVPIDKQSKYGLLKSPRYPSFIRWVTDSLEQVNGIAGIVLHHLAGTPYTKNQKRAGCPGHGRGISREAMVVWVFRAVGYLEMLPGHLSLVPRTGLGTCMGPNLFLASSSEPFPRLCITHSELIPMSHLHSLIHLYGFRSPCPEPSCL